MNNMNNDIQNIAEAYDPTTGPDKQTNPVENDKQRFRDWLMFDTKGQPAKRMIHSIPNGFEIAYTIWCAGQKKGMNL